MQEKYGDVSQTGMRNGARGQVCSPILEHEMDRGKDGNARLRKEGDT